MEVVGRGYGCSRRVGMDRQLTISLCDDCPHFDNDYYEYREWCTKLGRVVVYILGDHPIPDDCPLDRAI